MHLGFIKYLGYIDQGTGSIAFQAILSGFLTIVVFSKRIVAWFKYKFKKNNKTSH